MKVYIITTEAMKNVLLYFRPYQWYFLIDFDNFCTIGNKNEYPTKQIQTVSFQPIYVSPVQKWQNGLAVDRWTCDY